MNRRHGRLPLLIGPAVLVLTAGLGARALGLDVTLTVEETAGVERVQDACRSGVPVPPGALKDVTSLRLVDAKGDEVPAQFRVMNRRLTGDVEWVAVNFLCDVPANGKTTVHLKDDGPPKAVGDPVAVEGGKGAITIVTGPLKAVIPTRVFAGLGAVWLDANDDGRFGKDEQVSTGGALVIEGMDGKVYRSVKDLTAPLKVKVIERGPVLVVVRIDGEVRAQSADGNSHRYPNRKLGKGEVIDQGDVVLKNEDHSLGFTAHLYFWKGRSWVRTFVTMRNLKGQSSTGTDKSIRFTPYFVSTIRKPGNFLVDAVNMELDLAGNAPLRYRFGGGVEGSETHSGALEAGEAVVLYQDTSAGWLWQAGSGKVFDPLLEKNERVMKKEGVDRPYWEYAPVWYDLLSTRRDDASFVGYRLYRNARDLMPGSTTSATDLGQHAAEGMRAPGWVEVDTGTVAVTAGCRWLW